MTTGVIETPLGPNPIFGEIEADCYEVGGVNPTTIIRSNQAWEVKVKWKMEGNFIPWIDPHLKWHLHVLLESMGPGPEKSIFTSNEPWGAAPVGLSPYSKEWNDVETFNEDFIENLYTGLQLPHESALFKVFAILTLTNANGMPLECAGNVELGNLQWYRVPE